MQAKSSRYLINVPQGKSGRFIKSLTEFYDIEGCFTDSFSTCNIVVCIGQDKFIVSHVDTYTGLEGVKKEIRWVGLPNQLMIINREKGKVLEEKIVDVFKKEFSHIEVKKIREKDYGLAIYPAAVVKMPDASIIHPQIQTFSKKHPPENLLYHPLEEKFSRTHIEKVS